MKFVPKDPPRQFQVGFDKEGLISDCGNMYLEADEQITFVTASGNQYDVTRKDWGFYAGPSLNGRLLQFNLRAVLLRNRIDRYFIFLVERGKEDSFERYVREEPMTIVAWLDSTEALRLLETRLGS